MLKDLKLAKKEKKRCAKLYDDWKDDEYNCGPLKYVIGVKFDGEYTDNFNTLNDLDIYFNRDTEKYILSIDSTKSFKNVDDKFLWLTSLQEKLREYIHENGLFDFNISPFDLDLYKDGQLFMDKSISELYYKFSIFVNGFKEL